MEDDIAFACGFRALQDYQYFIDKLKVRGLIELLAPGKIRIVGWEEEQYQYPSWKPEATRERVRKHREKKRAAAETTGTKGNKQGGVTSPQTTPQTPISGRTDATPCNADVTVSRAVTPCNADVTRLENAYQQEFGRSVTPMSRAVTPCNATDKDTDTERDLDSDQDQEEEYINTSCSRYISAISQKLNGGETGKTRSEVTVEKA